MFLFIGNDVCIDSDNIIGIFDIDNTTISKKTRDFLNDKEKSGAIEYVNFELPKSFIVTKDKVFISPLNVATLQKRAKVSF